MMKPFPKGKSGLRQAEDPQTADATSSCPRSLFTQVIHGSSLCELVVWDDEQWSALPISQRPEHACHFPGLGWVCAIPVLSMN